jgi:hypothetical protein
MIKKCKIWDIRIINNSIKTFSNLNGETLYSNIDNYENIQ